VCSCWEAACDGLTVVTWMMQEEKAERERLARERKVQAKAKVKGKVRGVSRQIMSYLVPMSVAAQAAAGTHVVPLKELLSAE